MERKGFTLIEILIVVAIIAILASIVLVGLGPTQQSGRDARRISDLHEVQNGLELYYNKCGSYPGGATCGSALAQAAYDGTTNYYGGMAAAVVGAGVGIDTGSVPQDPSAGRSYLYGATSLTAPTSYVLAATLENTNNSVFTNYTPPAVPATGDITTCASPVYCVSL